MPPGSAPHFALLVNPASGRRRSAVAARSLIAGLRAEGARVTVHIGTSAADAAHRAHEAVALRPDALVAVGGDGLVHLALQAVVGTGVPLGLLPTGTGNDIARELGVGTSVPHAVERLLGGVPTPLDTVRCTGPGETDSAGGPGVDRHFLSVLACGFDSRVNERVNGFPVSLGAVDYVIGVGAELRTFRPVPYRIDVDGTVLEAEGMLAAVGNTRSYGGGMAVCSGARPDDGVLEVVFLHAVGVTDFLRFFPRVFAGTHTELDEVEVLHGRRVTVEAGPAPDGGAVLGYADGDPVGPTPLTCEVVPEGVTVLLGA